MHPGGPSAPGDPNAAFYLDGLYHLHYILHHPYKEQSSYSFIHITSPDLLNWTWRKTSLQPSFTGHGMFSGTGFITKEGRPAAIYHGQASGRNQIAIAKDNTLDEWEKPYPVEPKDANGKDVSISNWDPDCFLVGDTYYAISGGVNPSLAKSNDLKTWSYTGSLLAHDMPDVAIGEDVSCANFFEIDGKWMLLCISHQLGCRYYLGDWDAKAEQFVPEIHGRMSWRHEGQSVYQPEYRDFFAPESVLTPDGRRVMWAWSATLNDELNPKSLQSLPRELSLPTDGILRIKPLRELETLRYDTVKFSNLKIEPTPRDKAPERIADLDGEAFEIRVLVRREQAERKRFGVVLFAGLQNEGLPIIFEPENGAIRVGSTLAPFDVSTLPKGEDIELRIFIDKYLVEVFVNDRQAVLTAYMDYRNKPRLGAYSFGGATTIESVEIWKMRPTNQGYFAAQDDRIWEPERR